MTTPDLETRLRAGLTTLAEEAMSLTDTTRELARLEHRLQQERRSRRPEAWLSAAAAAAVVVLAAALLLPDRGQAPVTPADPRPTTAAPTGPATVRFAVTQLPEGTAQASSATRAGSGPVILASRAGELLVLAEDPQSRRVVRVDARTGQELGDLPVQVPAGFGVYDALALPDGLLVTLLSVDRAAEVNTVYVELDASGRELRRTSAQYFGVGNTAAVAEDGVWVGVEGSGLGRLQDGQVVDVVPLPFTPSAFTVTAEGFWLTDFNNDRLQLVDRNGTVVERLGSTDPLNVLAEGDRVVVAEARGLLVLDRAAGTSTRLLAADGASIRPGGRGLAVAQGTAYGVFDDGTLVVLPLDSPQDTAGYALPQDGSISAAVAGGLLWLGGAEDGESLALDPARL